ncbi:MAG TPA: hypothetical protein VFN91_13055 [Myxococcaceae bacterium]|nr:hypothetical protein [Myxococcaceae bacterium]
MKSRSGLIAVWSSVSFAVIASTPTALAAATGSTSQKNSRSVPQPELQQLIRRLDAMKEALDGLEQAMRAGSVDAQQRQITELRRQLAEMHDELWSAGDRPPRPPGVEHSH